LKENPEGKKAEVTGSDLTIYRPVGTSYFRFSGIFCREKKKERGN